MIFCNGYMEFSVIQMDHCLINLYKPYLLKELRNSSRYFEVASVQAIVSFVTFHFVCFQKHPAKSVYKYFYFLHQELIIQKK